MSQGQKTTEIEAAQSNPDVQGVSALAFTKFNDYTTFQGEYAITEGDLVFHFFRTPEVKALPQAKRDLYWQRTFAVCLNDVAQKVFEAGPPRLQGQFIDEPELGVVQSWWFRANGYGHLLEPHKKIYSFLDALDSALEAASSTQ